MSLDFTVIINTSPVGFFKKNHTLLETKPEIITKPPPMNKNYKKLFLVLSSRILGF